MARIRISDSTFSLVLLFSFVPFMVKAVSYIEAGNYVPFLVMDIIGLPLIYGFYYGKAWTVNWLKTWAIIMIVFGALRLALGGLVMFSHVGIEAAIINQVNLLFIALCLGYIIGGIYLLRNASRVLVLAD